MKKNYLRLVAILIFGLISNVLMAQTSQTASKWLDSHLNDPKILRDFLRQMPKGADLHTHLSGAVYAETYLALAKQQNACIDLGSYRIHPSPCINGGVLVEELSMENREAVIDHLSTRNLKSSNQSGRDRFFDSFKLFSAISANPNSQPMMLAEVLNRAASQNVLLLELMISVQSKQVQSLGEQLQSTKSSEFETNRLWLLKNGMATLVLSGKKELDDVIEKTQEFMHCRDQNAQTGCQVKLRFLIQTGRNSPPNQVFAQLVYAFELANSDPRIAGINIVSPEDGVIALRDYSLQMKMIQYLSSVRPEVKKALHAGELASDSSGVDIPRNHIFEAVRVANANRIGHGVDIAYENDALGTMELMRKRGIPVEVCLTSNDVILNVKGSNSPILAYIKAGVPVVLASDDEGVSRIDLTNEYVRAAAEQRLNYNQLKQISRNSLTWSFLPGQSLWRNPTTATRVTACQNDSLDSKKLSEKCDEFLNTNEKASFQWRLERMFQAFEAGPEWRVQ